MNAIEATHKMIAMQKQSFNQFQELIDTAQAQTASAMDRLMDQALVPEAGRRALDNWRSLVKAEQKRFAAFVDRGFDIYEKMLAVPKAPKTTKATKATKSGQAQ